MVRRVEHDGEAKALSQKLGFRIRDCYAASTRKIIVIKSTGRGPTGHPIKNPDQTPGACYVYYPRVLHLVMPLVTLAALGVVHLVDQVECCEGVAAAPAGVHSPWDLIT
jgi:hypothetical protein